MKNSLACLFFVLAVATAYNFDNLIDQYAFCLKTEFGESKVEWVEAYARKDFFSTYPEYAEHRIFAFVNRTVHGKEEVLMNDVLESYPEQMDVNIAPTPIRIDFKEELNLRTKETVIQEKTISFAVEMTITISLWFWSTSASAGIKTTDKTNTETSTEREHNTLSSRSYTVNPYTRARVQTAKIRRKIRQPYTVELAIEGDLAIKMRDYVPLDDSRWIKCGGQPPFKNKLGVYFVRAGVLAQKGVRYDNEDFIYKKSMPNTLVYPIKLIKEVDEEKLVFKIRGTVMEQKREQAYQRFCQ